MQIFKDRVPYTAIVDRPPLKLPNGKRMAVWFIANVEDWDISRPMPRTVLPPPMGVPLLPDLPNWSWHEYGMRVGFWRISEAFQKYGVCENYPRIAEEALKLDWEFMGHGYLQGPMHKHDDQQEQINRACEAIKKFSGKKVRGWESPGLTETFNTIDCLARAGIEYVADWVLDDQPIQISTTEGPVLSVPYTVETNDITMMALQQHPSSEMFSRSKDQFDRLYIESEKSTRIMSVSLHMYLTGAPHRIKYLEEFIEYIQSHNECVIMTGEEILDWYNTTL